MALSDLPAGRRLRASDVNLIIATINARAIISAVKGSDESVNSGSTGTTLHNDAALSAAVAANTSYWLDLELIYTEAAGTAIDLKCAWNAPALCRLDLANVGPHNAWVAAAGGALEVEWAAWTAITSFPSSTITFGTTNAATFSAHVRGVVANGANAGTLQFQWAQNSGSASNLTVKRGSALKLTPLA